MDTATLPEPIAALLEPATYPHPAEQIELVQTHISYVVLAGAFVYKLRKPVDFGFLDFTTLRKRLYDCKREVALNSRLCPQLYLGVVAVRHDGQRYTLDGPGRVVEYAVKMQRLPRERMMDTLLDAGQLTAEMVGALADLIAAFHRTPNNHTIDRYGSIRVVRRNWDENFQQTEAYVGRTLAPAQHRALRGWVSAFLRRRRGLFQRRVAEGRIRDGHGDLRTSAVCFTAEGICVYDCIEFNRRFRCADVAADVAFMYMDLEHRGHPELAAAFIERYVAASGDVELRDLLPFYACYRAYVRGKVESFRLDEPEVRPEDKQAAEQLARSSFALACRYAAAQPLPLLLVVCGLSGTGKSALAHGLTEALDMEVVSSDIVRKDLAGIAPTTHRRAAFGEGLYSARSTARTYAAMFRRAATALQAGRSVILDATFISRMRRAQARAVAERCGALHLVIECQASEPVVRARLEQRARDQSAVSDAGWETYLGQRARFEPLDELDAWQHITLDMDEPLERCILAAKRALTERLLH